MTEFLARHFIQNHEDTKNPKVREQYGALSGFIGILLNVLLFAGKIIAGTISGSIAVTADAFNNLSDAGSSIVTLLGFKLAGQKPDRTHPFGHGRIEYLSGLVVSVAILIMGYELARSSIEKILNPVPVEFSLVVLIILIASILLKGWMSLFNKKLGQKINSAAMLATASDSRSDALSTTAVLIGMVIAHFTSLTLDGWLGALVAVFILITGFKSIGETITPLLGQAPSPEMVEELRAIVMKHPEVLGIHDLVIHDYGPGRLFATFHAEIDRNSDIMAVHDVIDNIEREIFSVLHCETSIHMDPIITHDPKVAEIQETVSKILNDIDPALTFHDFRLTNGPDHKNLIFDVVVPLDFKMTPEALTERIQEKVQKLPGRYFVVVTVDTLRV